MDINDNINDGSLGWTKIDPETRSLILTLLARSAERGFRDGMTFARDLASKPDGDEALKDLLHDIRMRPLDDHIADTSRSSLDVLKGRHPGALTNVGLDQRMEDVGKKNNMP